MSMASIIAILWAIGFGLSVLIAAQQRMWFWGPTMIFLGIASALSIFHLRGRQQSNFTLSEILAGCLLCLWIGARAIFSPVTEFGQADLLLLCLAISTYLSVKAILPSPRALGIMFWGLASLFATSLIFVGLQLREPGLSHMYHLRADSAPTGFYGHYSYGASFFIALSPLFAAVSLLLNCRLWMRVGSGFLAIAGFVAIAFSSSRGGLIAACLGFAVLLFLAILSQRRKKWFGAAIVAYPLLLIAGGIASLFILSAVQEGRSGDGNLVGLMDNFIRLHLMSLAVSCIALHPWLGGGSRSFSWESFQFWDSQAMGVATRTPEHVHNEFVQTITDYGFIGAVLLLVFLLLILARSAVQIWLSEDASPLHKVLCVGGMGGLIGLLAHSNFEGIFRIPPGAILLGFCLAGSSTLTISKSQGRNWKLTTGALFRGATGVAAALLLCFFGFKGSAAIIPLWPIYHSKTTISSDEKIDRFTAAQGSWPTYELFLARGNLYLDYALANDGENRADALELALKDYQEATRLHPFSTNAFLKLGYVQARLGNYKEAKVAYESAVNQQGGMEGAYKAQYHSAQFLTDLSMIKYSEEDYRTVADDLQKAVDLLYIINMEGALWYPPASALFVQSHQFLGLALEQMGEDKRAFELYEKAAATPFGNQFLYNAAVHLHNQGVIWWAKRKPRAAYRFFTEANERLNRVAALPAGTSEEDRTALRAKLTNALQLLSSARVKPEPELNWE